MRRPETTRTRRVPPRRCAFAPPTSAATSPPDPEASDMATTDGENLRAVFKATTCGTAPYQIDEVLAERVAAFVAVTGGEQVVVGHDMRPSSPGMAQAFARGANLAAPARY